jgi:ribosomal protein S27AE
MGVARAGAAAAHAEAAAERSSAKAESAKRQLAMLADRLDKLTLVCLAMWSLLLEKTDLTEEDLMERVRRIDLMDGEADGKVTRKVKKCAKCDRTMSPKHRKCLYCGAEELKLSAFDEVL